MDRRITVTSHGVFCLRGVDICIIIPGPVLMCLWPEDEAGHVSDSGHGASQDLQRLDCGDARHGVPLPARDFMPDQGTGSFGHELNRRVHVAC